MKKNLKLHQWLLKWHFISGIIILPFVVLLSITGFIYLFKDTYENPQQTKFQDVSVQNERLSYDQLWEIANKNAITKPHSIILSDDEDQATEFISGAFGTASHLYVDPYSGNVTGEQIEKDSAMFTVRKLHGELLLGSWGTKIVELVGSWLLVMLITGIYIWWPLKNWKIRGLFLPRFRNGRRILFRDLHAITGFWFSIVLLMILAGGLPWTDVFGSNFQKLQNITNTGYPSTWNGSGLQSKKMNSKISIENVVEIAKEFNLPGMVNLRIPNNPKGVYSLSNTNYSNLSTQKMIHIDQYSGAVLLQHDWADVGFLMRGRMWFMAFHQGQMGTWNFILIAFTAFMLFVMSISAIISYGLRKTSGTLDIPDISPNYSPQYPVFLIIILLGIILPLFGLSVLIIAIISSLKSNRFKILSC